MIHKNSMLRHWKIYTFDGGSDHLEGRWIAELRSIIKEGSCHGRTEQEAVANLKAEITRWCYDLPFENGDEQFRGLVKGDNGTLRIKGQ